VNAFPLSPLLQTACAFSARRQSRSSSVWSGRGRPCTRQECGAILRHAATEHVGDGTAVVPAGASARYAGELLNGCVSWIMQADQSERSTRNAHDHRS